MDSDNGRIAVTGASGQLGRRVVELLAERVDPVRILALTRSPEKLAELAGKGVRVEFADFDRPEELRRSLLGVDRLLMISTDDVDGGRVSAHAAAVRAATEAGVGHVTYTSAPNPATSPLGFIREHAETEGLIRRSGLSYAFLRNSLYGDMLLPGAGYAISSGELRSAAGEGRIARVAREDCARAAAAVLATPGHDRVTYDVTGPASVSGHDIAGALARVSGRPVRYVPVTADEMRRDLTGAGLPPQLADMLVEIDLAIGNGAFDVVGSAVRDLTGEEPASVSDLFARHSDALRSPALA